MSATITTSVVTGGANNHSTVSGEGNAYATDFVSQGVLGSISNTNGVGPGTGSFGVSQDASPDMGVTISGTGTTTSGASVAYVTVTPASQDKQVLRARMTADYTAYVINANTSGSTKFDWIYLQASATNAGTPSAAADNVITLFTSRSTSNTVDNNTPPTYGILLAVVTVANGASSITNANIADRRTQAALSQAGTPSATGWTALGYTPSTVAANGNRSYNLTLSNVDLTGTVSNGMRLKLSRTAAAPTQSTSLNGTTQYYSKTSPAGMTFTNNFTVSAWVKLSAYQAGYIATRYNGTSGWQISVNASGQPSMVGYNGGAGNSFTVAAYQSLPLNKWVHLAIQMDMTGTATTGNTNNYILIDGVEVPATATRAGTNPTALIQAGNLEIGSANGGTVPFAGKLAQVAIYSAKVTEATILASMHQTLAGTETSLISAYSFNNSINDLNANANNLTANGSAVATATDSPFGNSGVSSTLEYGIITANSFSTNTTLTVQVPEGCAIPTSGGVSAVSYSTQAVPYGFPKQRGKWRIVMPYRLQSTVASNATFAQFTGIQLVVPAGSWTPGYILPWYNQTTTGVYWNLNSTSQTGLTSSTSDLSLQTATSGTAATNEGTSTLTTNVDLAVAATYLMYTLGATTSAGLLGSTALCECFAELATL